MLDQRRRRWASITTALGRYLMYPPETEKVMNLQKQCFCQEAVIQSTEQL